MTHNRILSSRRHATLILQTPPQPLPRRDVHMPSLHQVIPTSKQNHEPKQQTPPVHAVGRYRNRTGEQREDQNGQQPAERSNIDRGSGFSERPFAVGERFASQAFEQETADGDAVGGEQGGEIEREDGVEGGGRADVDEGEQDADDEGDDDGVEGDCGFGVDLVGVLLALSLLTHARRVSILT
jgi:hypothetical protein